MEATPIMVAGVMDMEATPTMVAMEGSLDNLYRLIFSRPYRL